jgi:hypothetical protein
VGQSEHCPCGPPAGQIEGMRVDRRVSAEEATEPHSQRNATAARSKTQSPPRTAVSHAQRLGKSMSGCGQLVSSRSVVKLSKRLLA